MALPAIAGMAAQTHRLVAGMGVPVDKVFRR